MYVIRRVIECVQFSSTGDCKEAKESNLGILQELLVGFIIDEGENIRCKAQMPDPPSHRAARQRYAS